MQGRHRAYPYQTGNRYPKVDAAASHKEERPTTWKTYESLVARLIRYAEEIDYGNPEETQAQLAAFNKEAKTNLEFGDFQGIYGGQEHHEWVRKVLTIPYEVRVPDMERSELVEMARRVMDGDAPDHAIEFWIRMLEINIPNERVSDSIFWQSEYFGDPDYSQELSPEQIVEIALGDAAASK